MQARYGLALVASLVAGPVAARDPLAPYRGTARVLVLSAPDAMEPRLVRQRAALAADRVGLHERDLVVIDAVGTDPRTNAIRRRLQLPADAFRAVLVGKDGGAKITSREPIPPQRLFSTIDAMPMRQDEMRRRR